MAHSESAAKTEIASVAGRRVFDENRLSGADGAVALAAGSVIRGQLTLTPKAVEIDATQRD
jgi:hypothetical protein